MSSKTKFVDLAGQRFQIAKLDPADGSFILFKLLGALSTLNTGEEQASKPAKEEKKPSAEEMVEMLAQLAFMRGVDLPLFSLIQGKCLACVSIMVNDAPLPLRAPNGVWTANEVDEHDFALLSRLVIDVLKFNFVPYFLSQGDSKRESPDRSKPSHSQKG